MVNWVFRHSLFLSCRFFIYLGYPGIHPHYLQHPWRMLSYASAPFKGSALCSRLSQEIPLTSASIFSMLTYAWVSPMMVHDKLLCIFLHVQLKLVTGPRLPKNTTSIRSMEIKWSSCRYSPLSKAWWILGTQKVRSRYLERPFRKWTHQATASLAFILGFPSTCIWEWLLPQVCLFRRELAQDWRQETA